MAFSKIAGLEVTPRSESSSIRRWSSPLSIIPRRIWSSHTLVPAAVSAASRSFTPTVTLMAPPVSSLPTPRADPVHDRPAELNKPVRSYPEVRVHVLGGAGLAVGAHPEELALLTDPAVPADRARGLDRHAAAASPRQDLVPGGLVLLRERVHAGHRHYAHRHAIGLH